MTAAARALRITPSDQYSIEEVVVEPDESDDTHLRSLYALIGCQTVEAIPLRAGIALWVDEDARRRPDAPDNPMLSLTAATLGWPDVLLGTGVFTSADPDTGELASLNGAQASLVRQAFAASRKAL